MATQTTNYGLTKPSYNETADIGVINSNMDIIDAKMKVIENKAGSGGGGGNTDTYGHVKVGSVTIDASGDDTIELVAGSNVTLTPDTTSKSVTISATGDGGTSVTVDSELSTTSENPVQNKVITQALNEKGTYSKPTGGIPKTDLASEIQTSLEKADTVPTLATEVGSLSSTIANQGDAITELEKYADTQSNRNLLDNPFFTVNQRGQTVYDKTNYGVDRWKTLYGKVVVNADGSISVINEHTETIYFTQLISESDAKLLSQKGKTITLSIKFSDNSIISFSGSIPTLIDETSDNHVFVKQISDGVYADFFYRKSVDMWTVQFNIDVGKSMNNIRAVKLELGTISTLANDIAPNYGEELKKCQRYYQTIRKNTQYATFGTGIARNSTTLVQIINLNVPMRVQPTLTYSGSVSALGDVSVSSLIPVLDSSVGSGNESDKVILRINYSGNFTTGFSYLLASDSGGFTMNFSADL